MMAQGGGNEREGLGKFVRNQSGYGTTVTSGKKTSQHRATKYIKHVLQKDDNLISLSLKYQVTVEVIKRENKLWNNDMLFLRECVLIPITPENEQLAEPDSIVTLSERDRAGSTVSNGSQSSEKDSRLEGQGASGQGAEAAKAGTAGEKKENPLDFFNKYDSNLAKLKSNVAKMEKNAEFLGQIDSHNPLQFLPRKGSTSSQSSRRTVSIEDGPSSPVLVIRTRTQARVVQDSLEKNQRASDDLFEL